MVATNTDTQYEWRLGSSKVHAVKRVKKPLGELHFDPLNQRIQFAFLSAGKDPSEASADEIEQVLREKEGRHIKGLYWAIQETGGALQPLVVDHDGKVIEGNCRLAALRELCRDYPGHAEYCSPSCEVLPEDFSEEDRLIYLGDCHVAGKQRWDAYEIAEHVYKMNQFGKSQEYIAHLLRMSKASVNKSLKSYAMAREFLHENPDPANLYKFSYFVEFNKKRPLRQRAEEDPDFEGRFFRWVKDGKLVRGEQVRKLPDFLDYPDVLAALDADGFETALKKYEDRVTVDGQGPFTTLQQAIEELELLPMKQLQALGQPDSTGAASLKELHDRLNAVAKMAGIKL